MATTSRGYPLFSGTDQPNGPAQMGALAQAIDADVASLVAPWVNYTPQVKNDATGLAVSITIGYAKYQLQGGTCRSQGYLTLNADCDNAAVTLPFLAKYRSLNCGTLGVFAAPPLTVPEQTGIARMTTDRAKIIAVRYTNGFVDPKSGMTIAWDVRYETA